MRRACVAAILLSVSAAHAFVPDGDMQLRPARTVETERRGAWTVQRDRETRAVTYIAGSYVTAPGAMQDAAIAERAARAFLAQHVLPAGTRIEDFVLVANRVDDGKRTVAFAQTWSGLRVVGGKMHVVFAADRLFAAGSDAWPNVTARVSRTRATAARATAWVQSPLRATGERVILPMIEHGTLAYRVADVFDAAAKYLDVYVAPDGTPLAQESRVHHATSTLQFDVGDRYASGTRSAVPASQLGITADGATTTTAVDGTFSWGTNVATTVTPSLTGARVLIVNEAGPLATTTLTAQPSQPVVWSAPADELVDAQLSAYIYGTISKAIGKRIAPSLAWLEQPMAIHVNIDQTCNAFSTGDSIHFYKASAECQNTARVADIVHHEFGHSFHNQVLIPGAGGFDGSITEGVADFFAANVSGDSGIGRGLAYDDKAVRELDPIGSERIYPRDLTGISHYTGLIIGGALWDLRVQLIAKLGTTAGIAATDKIFLGILQRASDVTKTYNAALVADDDDGNLGNGTPNSCIIESAFGRHGLAGADFRETRLLTPVIDGGHVAVTVDTPTGAACPPATVTAMKLAWRIGDGPPTDLAMTAAGATWSADLPAQPAGTVIEFQIAATLDTSETLLLPDNPADPLYQTFVGTATEIWCERFDSDPGWKQTVAEWEVDVSKPANAASGDPTSAFAGTTWLGTDLRIDGRYRSDILTSIETPAIDVSAHSRVHLQFRRWLVIEDSALDVATVRINGTQVWANASNPTFSLDHIDREWRFVDFDVSAFATSPISVAWTLASDPLRQLGGWNIDEVCLVGLDPLPTCGDGVVNDDEECDGDEHCTETCERRNDDGGCCQASGASFASTLWLFGLLQFVMVAFNRVRRR